LNQVKILLVNAGLIGSVGEVKLHLLEETGFTVGIKSWAGGSSGSESTSRRNGLLLSNA
jgi:hypothetical protein